jgi:hypothetical protein
MRRVVCLLLLSLFVLSNAAFATNWVYVCRSEDDDANLYVDDSVGRHGDTIGFWSLTVYDKPGPDGAKKRLTKREAKPPNLMRALEAYWYDSNNRLVNHTNIRPTFVSIGAGTPMAKVIDVAFKYAKEGNDTAVKPTP